MGEREEGSATLARSAVGRTVCEVAARDRAVWRWRKLSEAQDWSVRGEAQTHLIDLGVVAPEVVTPPPEREQSSTQGGDAGSPDWVVEARRRLAEGDYAAAAAAVRSVTDPGAGLSAVELQTLSRAALGHGDAAQASSWAERAVELFPDDPIQHCQRGLVAEADERWDAALQHYRAAAALDPADPLPPLAIGAVLLGAGRTGEAVAWLHQVYARSPRRDAARFYCGVALLAAAEAEPMVRQGSVPVVTHPAEIVAMRRLVGQAAGLRSAEPWLTGRIQTLAAQLEGLERRTFCPPVVSRWLGGRPLADQVAGTFVALLLGGVVVVSLRAIAEGRPWGVAVAIVGVVLTQVWLAVSWVPGWRANARRYGSGTGARDRG